MSDKSVSTLEGFLDASDDTLKNPRNIIDVYRKKFIMENMGPVHEKLTSLINKDLADPVQVFDKVGNPVLDKQGKPVFIYHEKERDHQVKTLWKFAEAAGTLGGEGEQAASVTKIYQRNNVIVNNPLIQQIIAAHTKELLGDAGKE